MIRYRDGYKYQLAEDYTISLAPWGINVGYWLRPQGLPFLSASGNCLTIKAGYAWDGPSGPAIDTASFMRGSLVHDALYQLILEGVLPEEHRADADNAMRDICRADGMGWLRAWWTWRAVRDWGDTAVHEPKKVKEAP